MSLPPTNVCVYVLDIQNESLLIYNAQKHCPSIWPRATYTTYKRVTKEIVRNNDDDDDTREEDDVEKKIQGRKRDGTSPLVLFDIHTHIYIYTNTHTGDKKEREREDLSD